jgi:uncharacterized protein (DUF1330 family)
MIPEKDKVEEIKVQISKNKSVHIKSINENIPLDQAIYAINWFNTSRLWLYNLYNLLAGISVKKIGGIPVFKARVNESLYGEKTFKRDILLIVKYPTASHFKKLVEKLFFQLVSVLRLASVNKFTFGFTHRSSIHDLPLKQWSKTSSYVIHHYTSEQDILKYLTPILEKHSIDVFYAGRVSSLLYSGNGSIAKQQIPCLMDGLVILESEDYSKFKEAINSMAYQSLLSDTKSSYIASLERIF